ncbi:MAG: excinuclease ABC subunit UvrC [Candidatus Dormibacteraeota bacterium]|nr:excinuclease ABC subunit UvrC [Candidatus Dormibacteraeota bacterium]
MVPSNLLKERPELLRERLKNAPASHGVYVMRDARTRVIYVGKSSNLRSRLRSYFQAAEPLHPRTARLVGKIFDFDVLTCGSEQEALILENTLIKRYQPRYNVRLRDDKSYLYMKVPRSGEFPRIYTVRRVSDDGARYFGPFTNAKALRSTMKTLRRVFPYRTCSDEIFRRGHVCLDYHIKRCAGPCEGLITGTDYHGNLDQIGLFMEGRSGDLVRGLKRDMQTASDALEFERAARLRDRLQALDRVAQQQWVITQAARDTDVLGLARNTTGSVVAVLTVRKGQVLGSEAFELEGAAEGDEAEVLNGFLGQFYADATSLPREILLAVEVADAATLAAFLGGRRGARVEVGVPRRGARVRLLEMARKNAEEALRQATIKKDYDDERSEKLLSDLQDALGMDHLPRRVECYDISNLMGTDPVGSMVVFEEGRPKTAHYRRFHIKGVRGSNDFAMMQEMLRRRFARLARARESGEERDVDSSFESLPDLVIIDGGKGQLSAAREVMEELGVHQVATFGLAKRKEELYPAGSTRSIMLPLDSPGLFLLQRIRDEAHRFAITFHRNTRARDRLASPLDAVPGVGSTRKRQLIKRFRSLAGVREATVEELREIVPERVARAIKEQV